MALTNEQLIAVSKVVKSKVASEASKQVEPGRYDVDLLVRIFGSLKKGEDFQQKVTARINFTLLAALALSKVNQTTRDNIVEDFIMAMGRSDTSDEHKKLIEQIKDDIQPKLNEIKEMTTTTMSGKITTDLTAEVVGGPKIEKVA